MEYWITKQARRIGSSVGVYLPTDWGISSGVLVNVLVTDALTPNNPDRRFFSAMKTSRVGKATVLRFDPAWGFNKEDWVTVRVEDRV